MKDVAATHHLLCRSGIWQFVRRVPAHLVPIIGKAFIRRSLRTRDKAEAIRLRPVAELEADALIAQAEARLAADPRSVSGNAPLKSVSLEMLTEHVRATVQRRDKLHEVQVIQDPPRDAEDLAERLKDADEALCILRNPSDPRHDEWIASATERLAREAGASLTDQEVAARFAEIVRRGLVEFLRRKIDRYDDRHDRPFHDILFDPARPSAVSFGELADMFIDEKLRDYRANDIREKSADRIKAASAYLVEMIGAGTQLQQIDDDMIQLVRKKVAATPSNRHKIYPGQSLARQIERAARDGKPLLSASTQGFYIDVLRDVLKVAVRKRLLGFNPAEDARPLKRETLSPEEKRLPWTPEQITGFFTGSFYQSCVPGAAKPYSRPNRPWRFWLPLIMLLTGARPGEILQLETGDIRRTEAGTWFMDLMNEDDGKMLKTSTSRRRVPLHPELVRMGFLAFVEMRKEAKDTGARLFHNVKPDRYGSLTDKPSKAFNRTFIPEEITLGGRQALYSLRHNVRDALRRIKAPPEALRHIAGWSEGKTASDNYGDPGNPDLMAAWVAGISYPGLDLAFLHVVNTKEEGEA